MAGHRVPSRPALKGRGAIARAASVGLSVAASISMSCTTSAGSGDDCRAYRPRPHGPSTSATPRAPRRGTSWNLPRQFEHVLLVVFENEDYEAVLRQPYFR